MLSNSRCSSLFQLSYWHTSERNRKAVGPYCCELQMCRTHVYLF